MKIKIVFGLLLLMLFFLSCLKESPTEPPDLVTWINLHIEGLVTLNGIPVSGATIKLYYWEGMWRGDYELETVITDSDGRYSIKCRFGQDCSGTLYIKAYGGGVFWDFWLYPHPNHHLSCTEKRQIFNIELSEWPGPPGS